MALRLARWLPALAAAFVLGCEETTTTTRTISVPKPATASPSQTGSPVAALAPNQPSAQSQALSRYYAGIEQSLKAQGLLRTDGGGPDTPFTRRQLVDNFVRIALFEEYANVGGLIVARQTPSRVHRWTEPVRMQVEFGRTVPGAQQRKDRANITSYANRLSRLTRLPIRQVRSGGNFHVFIVNEEERRALGPALRKIIPGISPAAVRTVTNLPRTSYCLVFAWDPNDTGRYSKAVAVIRGEHPELLRLSCIHEEIAQGLGLSNDSPAARPSVFNDDEEFALLTTHDELLLRMLYDPRMVPGMSMVAARATAERIAAELMR